MGFSIDGKGWTQTYNWLPTASQLNNATAANQENWRKAFPLVDTLDQLKKFANSPTYQGSQYILRGSIHTIELDKKMPDGGDNFFFLNEGTKTFDLTIGTPEIGNGVNWIFGNSLSNSITASQVDDHVQGGLGNDQIFGGAGNDELWGEGGDDKIDGGEGRDVLYGGDGKDTLSGGADNDLLLGGKGNDTLQGGDGDDMLVGGAGTNVIDGGAGKDTVYLSQFSANDKIKNFNMDEDKIFLIGAKREDIKLTANGGSTEIRVAGQLLATVDAKLTQAHIGKIINFGESQFKGY